MEKMDEIQEMTNSMEEKMEELGWLEKEEKCDICDGTGEVDDFYFDQDSKNWILDGTKKCVCQIHEEEFNNQDN